MWTPYSACWAMPEHATALRAILLPLTEQNLLLPAAVIAEVAGYVEPDPDDSWPGWVLGVFAWHGQMLPLISVEAALGLDSPRERGRRARIVVLHTLGGPPGLPRYGLLVNDTPRVVSIWPESLSVCASGEGAEPYVRQRVTLPDAESAIIPDLDALQGDLFAAG